MPQAFRWSLGTLVAMLWLGACTSAAPQGSSPDAGASPMVSNTPELSADTGPAPDSTAQPESMADYPSEDAATASDTSNAESPSTNRATRGADETSDVVDVRLPPENAGFDYQLGASYPPPNGVGIIARDRTESPIPGLYNICYVNGFQIQPGEESDWDVDLMLRDDSDEVVIDEDWNEVLLDVSTPDKRDRIGSVVGEWIIQCAKDGFDAVEVDNLDTYVRSGLRLTEDDAVAFMQSLAKTAHQVGLAIAQKNAVELVPRRAELGTDFVVAEECNAWEECDGYIAGYAAHVLMIEYGRGDFETACDRYGDEFSIVLRDRDLSGPDDSDYEFDGC